MWYLGGGVGHIMGSATITAHGNPSVDPSLEDMLDEDIFIVENEKEEGEEDIEGQATKDNSDKTEGEIDL